MATETIKNNLRITQTFLGDISATGNFYNASGLVTGGGAGIDTGVRALSANWQNTYTTVNTNSAQWASNVDTEVRALSANWQNSYTDQVNYLPLSGGTLTGATRVNADVTIIGNLSATGNSYFANTVYSTTSALSVINVGNTGPAFYVGNNGTGDIASFYDLDQGLEVLHVGGNNGTFPNVGIKTSTPGETLTVNGTISSSGLIYSQGGVIKPLSGVGGVVVNNNLTNVTVVSSNSTFISDTPPSGASAGDLWFDSSSGVTNVRYDSTWVDVGGGDSGTSAGSVNGIVKSDGSGNFSAAVAGTDYLTSATLGSSPAAVKAWVNFNGSTTTPTVRSSYNVVSVTRATAGDNSGYYHLDGTYKINFATGTFATTNYAAVGLCRDGAGALNSPYLALNQGASYKSTSHIWVDTFGVDWNDNTEVGLIFIS